jgi:UDP-N-acetylmuramoyl-tripeptide--D-alanyl-D-alanine ligase
MRNFLTKILAILAQLTLWRYKPKVVAITGSVGKTSTKDAVATILASKFSVRASKGNYNNEIGVPLTIINEESAGKNGLLWVFVFFKAFLKLFYTKYPQVLILEVGTDRPGDIGYLMDLLGHVDVGVITYIGISHLEFFAHQQELTKEKISLIKKLPRDATAVLNFDNQKIYDGKNQTKAEIIGYGFNEHTNLTISDFHIIADDEGSVGINFKIHHRGTVVPFFLPNALGKPMAYVAAAAAGVGLRFHIDLASASEALRSYNPPPGRLRLLDGIKHTRIIDDTYNAAPDSTFAALEALKSIAPGRKLAAIGDMAELGSKSDSGHREVGAKIVENAIDLVFLVGPKAKIIHDELNKRKFAGRVFWFENSDLARMPVQNNLIEGDTILIKGSQSMRMEKIVKEIMSDPIHAEALLVRQSGKWLNTP